MVNVIKNTGDNSSRLIKAEVAKIITRFNNKLDGGMEGWTGKTPAGCSDKWVELYASDYSEEALAQAITKIKAAGYYVWKIFGCYGRNCALDTVYRITKTCLKPTPGCTRV